MFDQLFNLVLGSQAKRKTILWLVIILVSALMLLVISNWLFFGSSQNLVRLSNWADPTKYQAVFLTNGQVYFGKVSDVNSQTLVLENIYYLRSTGNLQNAETQPAANSPDLTDNFSLIKLGNEIHGPKDRMSINLAQVLFTEDLKSDSKVVEAIRMYQNK